MLLFFRYFEDRIFGDIVLPVLNGPSACNAVKLALKVGFICPFVVMDHTYSGATTELFEDYD